MKRYGEFELKGPGQEDEPAYVTIRYPRRPDEKFLCKVIGAPNDDHPHLTHRNSAEFACEHLSEALGWLRARVAEYTRRGWHVAKLKGRANEIHRAKFNAGLLQPQPEPQAA